MLDCLITLVDQCADSEGLPAMGHLNFFACLVSRQEYCILRLLSLESTVVRDVLILQHWSSSTEICEVVLPLNARLSNYLSRPMCRLLPAMSHLKKFTSLFSRQEYCILRLRSLESTVVRVVLILQHLSSSTETCEVVVPLNARSPDYP